MLSRRPSGAEGGDGGELDLADRRGRGELARDGDFADFTCAGGGPSFGFGGEAIQQPFRAEAAVFKLGPIEIGRDVHLRADDGAGLREWPWHGEAVPALHSHRAIITEAHGYQRNLQPRGEVDRTLGELAAGAARAVRRDGNVVRAAAFFQLP